MTDSIIIQQEDIAPIKVVEREILLDVQEMPVVIESAALEIVTLENETHVVDETPQLSIITVGEQGPPGASNAPGPSGLDGDPGEDALPIPGPVGPASTVPGPAGADGRNALTIPGLDGDPAEEPLPIPGERGATGATGIAALTIPGLDGDPGEDALPIPGERGATGANSNVPGPVGPPGVDGEGEGGGEGFMGMPTPSPVRWPMVYPTVDDGDILTIPAGYQFICVSRFSALGSGRVVNLGKMAVL